jgi:hypothetical protein
MKTGVTLPSDDVEFLDGSARQLDLDSRPAALHRATAVLRAAELEAAYEHAWDEQVTSCETHAWGARPLTDSPIDR